MYINLTINTITTRIIFVNIETKRRVQTQYIPLFIIVYSVVLILRQMNIPSEEYLPCFVFLVKVYIFINTLSLLQSTERIVQTHGVCWELREF